MNLVKNHNVLRLFSVNLGKRPPDDKRILDGGKLATGSITENENFEITKAVRMNTLT